MKHTCLNNRVVKLDLNEEQKHFFETVSTMLTDEDTHIAFMYEMVFGPENPYLFSSENNYTFLGNPAIFSTDPFIVLVDLIDRKRAAKQTLDLGIMGSRYTVPLREAAQRAGIRHDSGSGIRAAIDKGEIQFWSKNGEIYLEEETAKNSRLLLDLAIKYDA